MTIRNNKGFYGAIILRGKYECGWGVNFINKIKGREHFGKIKTIKFHALERFLKTIQTFDEFSTIF